MLKKSPSGLKLYLLSSCYPENTTMVVLFIPRVVTFYLADTIFHHDVNVVESHEKLYNSHHDEKFHFLLHCGHGIYQLKIPLVMRSFMVAAVRCKIKKPLAQPTVMSAYEPSSCATSAPCLSEAPRRYVEAW
jgi:hypothetical protein